MKAVIRPIQASETYKMRLEILRPNETLEKCMYPGDKVQGAVHLGAFFEGRLVGIVTCSPEASHLFVAPRQFRIRGMAVLPEFRRHNIGSELVAEIEEHLRLDGPVWIWFNAREVAFRFYESLGYQYASAIFEMEGIGPHRVMFKELK